MDYILLNFKNFLDAKTYGGTITIPYNVLKDLTPQQIDTLTKTIFNTPEEKLRFLKYLTEDRANKQDFVVSFYSPAIKKEIQNIERFFKQYPNLNYTVSKEIYNYPQPELLSDALYYKGFITSNQAERIKKAIINRDPIVITSPELKTPKLTNQEILDLIYPSKMTDDLFKYKTAISEFYETGLDITPSIDIVGMSILGLKFPSILKSILKYNVAAEVSKDVVAPLFGYKSPEEREKIAQIIVASLYTFDIGRFLLKYYLYLGPETSSIIKNLTTSVNISTSLIKRRTAELVAKKLGFPKEVAKFVPKYNENIEPYIIQWMSKSTQPLTRAQNEFLINFLYSASHTSETLYHAGRIWRIPSVGGVNPLHWAKAIDIVFGKGAGLYINKNALLNLPIVQFVVSYSRPVVIDTENVRTYANYEDPYSAYRDVFSRPYILYQKPYEIKPEVISKPHVEPIKPPIPTAITAEGPTITKKVIETTKLPTFVIPLNIKPNIINKIEKSFNKKISEIVFTKIADDKIGFEVENTKNIISLDAFSYDFRRMFANFFNELPKGRNFNITYETPNELEHIKNLFSSKFHSLISEILKSTQKVSFISDKNFLGIFTDNFSIIENLPFELPSTKISTLEPIKLDIAYYLKKNTPDKFYAMYSRYLPEYFKIGDTIYTVDIKKVLGKINKFLKLTRIDAYNIGVLERKNYAVIQTPMHTILFGIRPVSELPTFYVEALDEKIDFSKYKREVSMFNTEMDNIEKNELILENKIRSVTSKTFVWDVDDPNAYTFLNRVSSFVNVDNFIKFAEFVDVISNAIGEKLKPKVVLKRTGFKNNVLGAEAKKNIFLRVRTNTTALHELGHYLHDVIEEYTDLFKDLRKSVDDFRDELRIITKYVRPVFNFISEGHYRYRMRWQELIADYVEMYLLAPDLAVELAPNFTEKFEQFIKALNLSDVINRQTAEVFFNNNSPQRMASESLVESKTIELENIINKIEKSDVREKLRELVDKVNEKMTSFSYYFLNTFTKIIDQNNPVLTTFYLDIVEKMVSVPNAFDNEVYQDFHRISKLLPEAKDEIEAFQTLLEYHIALKHEELVNLDNYKTLFNPQEFELLKKVYPVYKELINLVKKITNTFLKYFEEINPEQALAFKMQWSKKPAFLPLSTSGNYILYIEQQTVDLKTKKSIVIPSVIVSNDIKLIRKLIKAIVKLGDKFRLYGFDGYYTVFKTEKGEVDAVITTYDYEKHKKAVDEIRQRLLKEGIKYEMIQGNIVYDDERFYTQLPFGMLSVAEILSILEKRGLHLSPEEQDKIYDVLNFNSPNLLHSNFRLWNYFTPQDIFSNIANYARHLRNFLMHKGVKKILIQRETDFNTLTPLQQQVVRDFLYKSRGEYRSLSYFAGSILSAIYLAGNLRFYYQNILQVPTMLRYLAASYGFLHTTKAYIKALLYLAGVKKVSKNMEIIEQLYKTAEKTGEFTSDVTEELVKIYNKAYITSKNPLKHYLNAFHTTITTLIRKNEHFNRELAYLTGLFLAEELFYANKYPRLAGKLFKVNFTSPEGIKEAYKFATLVNTLINIKYNPIEVSMWGKTPLLNLTKIFLTFPTHFATLDLHMVTRDLSQEIVDRLSVEYPQFAKDFKSDKFKNFFKNLHKKSLFLFWLMFVVGLKGMGIIALYRLFQKFGDKKKRSSLSYETLKLLENKWLYDWIMYGFNGGLFGIDISSSLGYYDNIFSLAQDFRNLVVFRTFQDIIGTMDYGKYSAIEMLKRMPVRPFRTFFEANDVIRQFEFYEVPLTNAEKLKLRLGFTPSRIALLRQVLYEYRQSLNRYKREKSYANDVLSDIIADIWLFAYLHSKETRTDKKQYFFTKIENLSQKYINMLEKYSKEFNLTKQDIETINVRVREKLKLVDDVKSRIMKIDRPDILDILSVIKLKEEEVAKFFETQKKIKKELENKQNEILDFYSDPENVISEEITPSSIYEVLK